MHFALEGIALLGLLRSKPGGILHLRWIALDLYRHLKRSSALTSSTESAPLSERMAPMPTIAEKQPPRREGRGGEERKYRFVYAAEIDTYRPIVH